MKEKIIAVLKFLIFLAIGLALFWFAFRGQDIESIKNSFQSANYSWILLSMFIAVFSHISRTMRWLMLIEPLGYRPKLLTAFYAVMIGYLANLAIPRMGEITRCGVLNKAEGIPLNKLIGTIITERVIDLITLLILFFITILIQLDLLGNFVLEMIWQPLKDKIASSVSFNQLLVFFIFFMLLLAAGIFILKRIRKKQTSFFLRFQSVMRGLWDGIKTIKEIKNKKIFIAHSVFIWMLYFLMSYVCFFAIPATTHLGLMAGLTVLVMGSLGVAAPVQGGIGAFHWIVSITMVLYGVSQQDGLVSATLIHGGQMVLVIIIGFASLIGLSFLKKKKTIADE